jgi:uncharacterized protein DUF6515
MKRQATAVLAAVLVVFGQAEPLLARGRGSVSGASRGGGSYSRSGNTGSWQGRGGNASGSRTVSQTSDGYNVNKQVQTQGGASKTVNKDVNTEDRSVDRSSTATNQYGQSASRERTVQGEGGYATVEGSGSTSTGRSYSGEGAVGRNAYGQPVAAGSVNTKYNGSYAGAAAKSPYGGWNTATVGPYGGKVTTTLPSGYKTTSYYGRSYYSYGGAYYRPYTYGGAHYYYPVPPPYYAYYESPPTGAVILMVAGASYLMSQQGNYSKQTTTSEGKVVYQSVPAPQGATLAALPAERALVTVAGTTYFLYANTFYRRVVQGTAEQFVVVSPPAGIVFVPALPADFQVVQLNTMYFSAGGRFYVPYLATDGKELYALVDAPPQPPPAAGAPSAPSAPPGSAPPPVRTVAQSFRVPAGTLLLVRVQADLTSATAKPGDRFQGFLDQDLAADGRLVAAHGTRVYGVIRSVDPGDKMKGKPTISAALTDLQVGDQVVAIQTQPVSAQGQSGGGAKKILGGVALGAAIGGIADGGDGAAVGAAVGGGVGMAGAAAGSPHPAVLVAQAIHAFTIAAPFQVDVMTNVAVR